MGQVHKNCANSHLDTHKDNRMIPKRITEAVIRLMTTPIAQYMAQKIQESLAFFEEVFNWSIPQTNNNFRGHVCDLKNTSHNDEMHFQINNNATLTWLLLFPIVLCFHICHFYINITLFMVNKPPVEFQDLKWLLQSTRLRLTDLMKNGSKKRRYHQKLVAARLTQYPPEMSGACRIFSKWPLRFFVTKLKKVLNFLGIIIIPLHRDLKSSVANNHVAREEKHGSKDVSKNSAPTQPVLTRRVSVTVQEIIFEETEDSLENIKNTTKNYFKPTTFD